MLFCHADTQARIEAPLPWTHRAWAMDTKAVIFGLLALGTVHPQTISTMNIVNDGIGWLLRGKWNWNRSPISSLAWDSHNSRDQRLPYPCSL
ncbi:hypothetical protein N8703_00520 [Verrucomicrobia bacterium]|nr:hypothetical protein [Verrucomicrobiota bacterium]